MILPQEALSDNFPPHDPVRPNTNDAFNVSTKSLGDGLDAALGATDSCADLVLNVMIELATIPSWTNGICRFTAPSLDSTGNFNATTTPTFVMAGAASEAQVITGIAPLGTVATGRN
jgi:hypothetical protein